MRDLNQAHSTSLRSSEWALAGSFLSILLALVMIAKIKNWHCSHGTESPPVLVAVEIAGHVDRPDTYEIACGTPLEEVLRLAGPKRYADLRRVDAKSPVTQAMQLQIESLKHLEILVTGAVEKPQALEVDLGTRICHLKHKIVLAKDADLAFFKKRRLLGDGEVVEIPFKKN